MRLIPVYQIIFLAMVLLMAGCGVYSFTGASIPPEAKTISIQYLENNADLVEPTLSPLLTELIRDRFQTQTTLDLTDQDGDLQIEGEIVRYVVTPVAIQSDDVAALNRLTISVKIKYTNTIEVSKDYETTFSRFEDFPSDQDLSEVNTALMAIISEQLVTDIFNKAVVNW